MKISDAMIETGLTRKAIYYYEELGLISPTQEGENSYRNYSESDIQRLKQIKALRLLDISLDQIKSIFDNPLAFNDIMEDQLEKIKEKIDVLNNTENIIKSMLTQNGSNNVSLSKNLDKLNHYLVLNAKASKNFMKKELERILPSGFGKLMAIMYGTFLDEPIDSKEKEMAWLQLVNTLDSTEIVEFPDEINSILNKFYEQISKEGIDNFDAQIQRISNNISSFSDNISEEEKEVIKGKMDKAQNQEGYNELLEMSKKLFQYIQDNPNIIPADFSKYLKILSKKYNEVINNFSKAFKSEYTIGKTFGTN